jgi:hypothetical protein
MRTRKWILTAALVLAAAPALAAGDAGGEMDTNGRGGGALLREQFEAKRAALFQEADADRNGMLTPSEFARLDELLERHRIEFRFRRLDANGDGSVSIEEFTAARPPWRRGGRHQPPCLGQ